MALKYLFAVRFRDGSEYHQTAEDVSLSDPSRSAFFDVASRLDEVEMFAIENVSDPPEERHHFMVDLTDGHFEVDGVPFYVQDPSAELPPETERRLIYFRRRRHTFTLGLEEIAQDCEYHLGWQATVDGKNVQFTIAAR